MTLRRGFTLLEVLVAVAVVAVLVGLLLPAVQKVRGAAAGASCRNRLKQLALALHARHDADGTLPPAVRSRTPSDPTPYLSWRPRLLPYLEQNQVWEATTAAYRAERNPFLGPTHAPRVLVLPVFGCPADGRLETAWEVSGLNGGRVRTALSSYLGVSGTDSGRRDGMLYQDSGTRLTDVADGTSNTLLLGERPPPPDLVYGWWYAGTGQRRSGSADAHLGVAEVNRIGARYHGCGPGPFPYRASLPGDGCAAFQFTSSHAGGAHFALADGSVRFLAYSSAAILPALATRAGSDVASPDG